MRKEKNRLSNHGPILGKGFLYLLLLLLLNIGFSPLYELIAKKLKASVELELNTEEEERSADESERLTELDEKYFSSDEFLVLIPFKSRDKSYFHLISNLLFHFPEKDSPPPKDFYSLF